MISRLRKKITLVLSLVMCLLLFFLLTTAIGAFQASFLQRTSRALRAVPGPEMKGVSPRPEIPVALVQVNEDGTIQVILNQIYALEASSLESIASDLQEQDLFQGEVEGFNLRFLRHPRSQKVLYSFVDITNERSALRSQITIALIVGVGAAVLFVLVSWFLAGWLVQPVAEVWEKHRRFVADASHELKTPLTVILSNSDMLLASHAVTDERNRLRLEDIGAESRRMRSLVEDLLTLARTDNMPVTTPPEDISLSFAVSSCALTMEPSIYDCGHSLVTDIEPDLRMKAHSPEIHHLTEILLDNAGKYSTPGSDIHLRLFRRSRREALLQVISEGVPLTREECSSVFERFSRADPSRSQKVSGYGLGLSIARNIAEHLGGSIRAFSDQHTTNTFEVRFPLIS